MKITAYIILIALIVAIAGCNSTDDNIHGLWLITSVKAGDQEMTPIAKWTRISGDGTYDSGNGWLKSSEGTWSYDKHSQSFLPKETNGLIDPHGAFSVNLDGDEMTWRRVEDRTDVVVSLTRIEDLPKAPADDLQGLWDLSDVQESGESVMNRFDPVNQHYLFFRWDRIYVERTPGGNRQTGYWHLNSHRPEITLISQDSETDHQNWKVDITGDRLRMTGISDSNGELVKVFSRLKSFPG